MGTTCPDDVTLVIIIAPVCGYLSVPEDRADPGGREIRIFVVRLDPVDGIQSPDPMVVVGDTLGGRLDYGGLAIVAQRTGRVAYLVDRRGTGLSEPRLTCPEIDAARSTFLAYPSAAERGSQLLLAAVGECRARLVETGVDLADYGIAQSALDIRSLRVALAIDTWNVIAFGSASRLAFEVARLDSDGVRTVVLDSPVLPQGPDPMFNRSAARSALDNLDAACAADATCHAVHPDPSSELERVVVKLDQQPIEIDVDDPDAGTYKLIVDGTRFARAARNMLAAAGGRSVTGLLQSMIAAENGSLVAEDFVPLLLARSEGLCLGYVPNCDHVEYGSLLTTVCAEVLPFVDREVELRPDGEDGSWSAVFATNPFFDACDAWDLSPADSAVVQPPNLTMPLLAMGGRLDPYTGPVSEIEAALAGLPRATFVEVPRQSYNIYGFNECPRLVRRPWLDDPTVTLDLTCFETLPEVVLVR